MASKKKTLTAAVALGTAAALVLGGTFAWQSINQTALNQRSDDVNPGGRLHDDFNGENKDVYVENFADEPIFARIRLEEYLEVIVNYEGAAETPTDVVGTRTVDDKTKEVTRTHKVFEFKDTDVVKDGNGIVKTINAGFDEELTEELPEGSSVYWWTWTMGSADSTDAYYMPTFNLNKDSLVADVNGSYYQNGSGIIASQDTDQYTDYVEYGEYNETTGEVTAATEDAKINTMTGTEIFDADYDTDDEVGSDFSEGNLNKKEADGDIETYEDKTHHTGKIADTKGLISMENWLELLGDGDYDADTHGGYWVYDTDGWVYWSSPIAAGETTGRLLDAIQMNGVMDDSWYYSINVVAQFVTADDVGKTSNTGFYADNETVSENAEKLLASIGVDMTGERPAASDDGDSSTGGGQTEETAADWSQLVTMRNITNAEYDKLVELTGGDNDKMHWQGVRSWTSEGAWEDGDGDDPWYGYYMRGGYSADQKVIDVEDGLHEFRPAFAAKDTDSCADLTEGDAVVIGTLYIGETPVSIPLNADSYEYEHYYDNFSDAPKITLGTALEDESYQMKAIYIGSGVFVCDHGMITDIEWTEINAALN